MQRIMQFMMQLIKHGKKREKMQSQTQAVIPFMILVIMLVAGCGQAASNGPDALFRAAELAAASMGEYFGQEMKKTGTDGEVSREYQSIREAAGSRTALFMGVTIYKASPHPHKGNMDRITSMEEKWKFITKYGEDRCETAVKVEPAAPVSAVCCVTLQGKKGATGSGGRSVRVSVNVDYYAGDGGIGYFSTSLNRLMPVTGRDAADEQAFLQKMRNQSVTDAEAIVKAINDGLKGMGTVLPEQPMKPPTTPTTPPIVPPVTPPTGLKHPPVNTPSVQQWSVHDPLAIASDLKKSSNWPPVNPCFHGFALMSDNEFSTAEQTSGLDSERLLCLGMPSSWMVFTATSRAGTFILMLTQRAGRVQLSTQLTDGRMAVTGVGLMDEALVEASRKTAEYLSSGQILSESGKSPETAAGSLSSLRWIGGRVTLSAQEYIVLRGLQGLSVWDEFSESLPFPGFTLEEISDELCRPSQQKVLESFSPSMISSVAEVGQNRNDLGVALTILQSRRLVKRASLNGKLLFSLTAEGRRIAEKLLFPDCIVTVSAPGISSGGRVMLMNRGDEGYCCYFSGGGNLLPGNMASGEESLSWAEAISKMVNLYLR